MTDRKLTLEEVEMRQRQLDHEAQEDAIALFNGNLEKAQAIERDVYRQFERRWLEMEALLLKPEKMS
jgi:hypothetical protein